LPVVKCPIFDYFTGIHLLRMGIKESIKISKINLFKTATVKLEKVLNLDFPDVCYYYATAVFETTKMDKKFNVDWNLILKVYFQMWQKSGFESGNKECWDFLCTLIWPMFQKKTIISLNLLQSCPSVLLDNPNHSLLKINLPPTTLGKRKSTRRK